MAKRVARWVAIAVACAAAAQGAHALLGLNVIPGAAAQVPTTDAGKGREMRTVYATPADVAEGKRLAQTACANCHGANGISAAEGIPHLAGQRPAYLYMEMRAYQTGERGNSAMAGAVKFLSDDALVKVAAYYATLDPAAPAPAKAVAPKADPVQAGKAAAAACSACHGDGGVSKTPGMPSLAGFDAEYLVAATKAYKSERRKSDVMKPLVSGLSDADVNNVALYYALQKPAAAATPRAGDAAAGKAAASACAGCHGDDGNSATPKTTPTLAGQDAQYLVAALRAYKNGSRSDDAMKALAASLDDATAANVAAFYAGQQPKAAHVRKPISTAEWVQRCDRCHGTNGNSTDPRLPAIAAQRIDYLERVLHAYRKGERKSSQMAAMSDALTEADVESLAAYYARQKARSVVFVIMPAK
jgi:cytochrome c553